MVLEMNVLVVSSTVITYIVTVNIFLLRKVHLPPYDESQVYIISSHINHTIIATVLRIHSYSSSYTL